MDVGMPSTAGPPSIWRGSLSATKEHKIVSTYITKMFGSPLKKDLGVGI